MFTERIQNLAKSKNIKIAQMLKDLNMGQGTFSTWKKRGTVPNGETLQRIADYFGVTVDYLLGKPDEKEPEPRERIFFSYAKESEEFHRLLEPIIKDPTPIQTAYDKASPEIQAAVRKLLDL